MSMEVTQVGMDETVSPAVARRLEQMRETLGKVVGSVFFGTLLGAMRSSTLKGSYGHGGRGEEVFAGQLHGMLAERMGMANSYGLGEGIFKHYAPQAARMAAASGVEEMA